MTNSLLLQTAMIKAKINKSSMAKLLGLSLNGFLKKLNGQTEFKASEIYKSKRALKLSAEEVDRIFFSQERYS